MCRSLRFVTVVVTVVVTAVTVSLSGCAGSSSDASGVEDSRISATPPAVAYGGGGIVQNVEVYAVLWGKNVDARTAQMIPGFYPALLQDGPFMQMLAEYDVAGQSLGNGVFAGVVIDAEAPVAASGKSITISDQMIQAELLRLIDQGELPVPDGRTLFMLQFPPGVSISAPWGNSCDDWCAYHSDFQRNHFVGTDRSADVFYGVIPDYSGADNACGPCANTDESYIQGLQSSMSHELVESITEPVYPVGWIDVADGDQEIADLCAYVPAEAEEGAVGSYTVQRMWSIEDQSCRDKPAPAKVFLSAVPAQVQVLAGSTVTLTVTAVAPSSGPVNSEKLQLGFDDFYEVLGGASATFDPPSISVGESSTMTITVAASTAPVVSHFYITGFDSTLREYHVVQPSLTVKNQPPVVKSYSPASGRSYGGSQITIALEGNHLATAPAASIGNGLLQIPALASLDDKGHVVVTTPGYPIPAGQSSLAVKLTLTNPDGHSVSVPFSYTRSTSSSARPQIAAINVPSGPISGGTLLTVAGINFGASASNAAGAIEWPQVLFGSAKATVTAYDATQTPPLLTLKTPAHASGSTVVTVLNADGSKSTDDVSFQFGPNPPPQLLDHPLSIESGPSAGGAYVSIFGSLYSANLEAGATVTFGGVPAKTVSAGAGNYYPFSTEPDYPFVNVIAPAHAPGVVDVVLQNPDGQQVILNGAFTYL